MSYDLTAWQTSTMQASALIFSTTPCMMPTKGSSSPKSVVKVTARRSDMYWQTSLRRRLPSSAGNGLPGPHTKNEPAAHLYRAAIVQAVDVAGPGMGVGEVR